MSHRHKHTLTGLLFVAAGAACTPPEAALVPQTPQLVLPADPRITAHNEAAAPSQAQHYDLMTLIDQAQRNNPRTRAAWERANQAAAGVGLVDSTYLPRLSAEILAGSNRGSSAGIEDPLGLLPPGRVNTKTTAGAAVFSVQWLLFDFGVRQASKKIATEVSLAANIAISGAHQALIYEVAQAYYNLQAASATQDLQRRRLAAAQEISRMAAARQTQQLATVTEKAQADQFVAQARFDLTTSQSLTSVASTRLATLAGLPPGTRITPSPLSRLNLPSQPPAQLHSFIENALQRRPDLQAAFARTRASEAGIEAIDAAFRPKVIASAALGRSFLGGTLGDDRIGSISADTHRQISGVYLGVSIPIWSANARTLQHQAALADAAAAQADAEQLRRLAEGELIMAYDTLKASLAAFHAANQLVATAKTTYEATLALANQGLATVAAVDTTLKLLYDAEIARVEAIRASRSASILLAFASGQIGNGVKDR